MLRRKAEGGRRKAEGGRRKAEGPPVNRQPRGQLVSPASGRSGLPFARHGRVNSRPATAGKRGSAAARLSGHKNIIRIFWVKLFVARFLSDFKESEAVCVNYFCAVVPFWEWGVFQRKRCSRES